MFLEVLFLFDLFTFDEINYFNIIQDINGFT